MSTFTPRTESVQIAIDLSPSVMTPTLADHLRALTTHLTDPSSLGHLTLRPSDSGRWSGSVDFTDSTGHTYEAATSGSPEGVLAQLRERIGA